MNFDLAEKSNRMYRSGRFEMCFTYSLPNIIGLVPQNRILQSRKKCGLAFEFSLHLQFWLVSKDFQTYAWWRSDLVPDFPFNIIIYKFAFPKHFQECIYSIFTRGVASSSYIAVKWRFKSLTPSLLLFVFQFRPLVATSFLRGTRDKQVDRIIFLRKQ